MGGPIGTYATDTATPKIPFWLVKKGSKSDPFRREPKWRTCFDADMRAPLEGGGVLAQLAQAWMRCPSERGLRPPNRT
jgi:hypothetical protein